MPDIPFDIVDDPASEPYKRNHPADKSRPIHKNKYTYSEFVIKKKNGKIRKIVNPSPELKKYQRSRLKHLTHEFMRLAGDLHTKFHGFVPYRNSRTACEHHIGFEATTMFDFTDFFDTVTRKHLKAAGLKLNPDDDQYLFHKDGYCGQGFPTSPMLANIAIIPLISELDSLLRANLGTGNYAITVYADDIQISTNKVGPMYLKSLKETVEQVVKTHNLVLNPNKTRTKYTKYGARRILGMNVWDDKITATRKTNRKVRAVRNQVDKGQPKGQVLGGLRNWQNCPRPKMLNGFSI